MEPKTDHKEQDIIILYAGALFLITGMIAVILMLFLSQANTILLLKKELLQLKSDQETASLSSGLLQQYSEEEERLSSVFPGDTTTISIFISDLETVLKQYTSDYSFKFNSLIPIPENDKSFLLLTINMKTDFDKLMQLMAAFERMPYMTHIVAINSRAPQGYDGMSDIQLGIKLYVQNTFKSK